MQVKLLGSEIGTSTQCDQLDATQWGYFDFVPNEFGESLGLEACDFLTIDLDEGLKINNGPWKSICTLTLV